jgi:DNA repair protein RadD
MQLRDYQQNSVTALYEWFEENETGNPCLCLPGGSGKSVIIAAIVKDALQNWPGTRVLMLVHVKELLVQNSEKMRAIWPNAPMGIYSASLNRRCATEPITYAGIGSVAKRAKELGHIDICIIDEAHSISNEETGSYRKLIADLMEINPSMRCVGLTASPYRVGQGMLTDGDNPLFTDIIEPVTIEGLLSDGYLAPLRSKHTALTLSTEGVKKSGGDFIASQLEKAVDKLDNNVRAVDETIARSEGCYSWLVFCTGISHATHITDLLRERGVVADVVHGKLSRAERDERITLFKAGKITALVSVGILTTGFDHPQVDLIVFLRPTMSPGLYLQCAVRGSRPVYAKGYDLSTRDGRFEAMFHGSKPNGCRVLDFAGCVQTHGPITHITPPGRKGSGVAPTRKCPQCEELCHASALVCTNCGHEFPPPEAKDKAVFLRNDCILGIEPTDLNVTSWTWSKHTSRTSGLEMLKVKFYGGLNDPIITAYHTVMHENWAGSKACKAVAGIAHKAGLTVALDDLSEAAKALNVGKCPSVVQYRKNGKFFDIVDMVWSNPE